MSLNRPDKFKEECINCGACCRLIGLSKPELDRGDFGCIFLEGKNKCRIYEIRPRFCNVFETFNKKYKSMMTWDDFKTLNKKLCIAARSIVKRLDNKKNTDGYF